MVRLGAMTHDPSSPTTSPRPAWTLRGDFPSLFKPQLTGEDLAESIGIWQNANLRTVGRARIMLARERAQSVLAVGPLGPRERVGAREARVAVLGGRADDRLEHAPQRQVVQRVGTGRLLASVPEREQRKVREPGDVVVGP
jgi:hypothetical protein